jgi:peptidoglycan/LPS O-acetylase OafA/YrhL
MSSAARPAEIKALAGARALPPLLLVLYHYSEGHGYQLWRPFDLLACKGYLWVEFFFALSGFILIHVYTSRAAGISTGAGYLDFLRTRLARLYPLHLTTLLIMLFMIALFDWLAAQGGYKSIYEGPGYHPYATAGSFVANLFLVQAWHTVPALSWNGVAWFVSVEFFLCLIFPVFLWISRGALWRAPVLIVAGFVSLWLMAQNSGHGLDITFDFGIVRGMADFSIGVGLSMLYRRTAERARSWPEWTFTASQVLALLLFVVAIYDTGWSHDRGDFWVVPAMVLIIATLAFDRGAVARVFASRPLLLLGEWSFAIYMGQTTWLQFLRFAQERLYPNLVAAPGVEPTELQTLVHRIEPAVLVIICIAWGYLLYLAVEKPASDRLRRLFAGTKERGTAPA